MSQIRERHVWNLYKQRCCRRLPGRSRNPAVIRRPEPSRRMRRSAFDLVSSLLATTRGRSRKRKCWWSHRSRSCGRNARSLRCSGTAREPGTVPQRLALDSQYALSVEVYGRLWPRSPPKSAGEGNSLLRIELPRSARTASSLFVICCCSQTGRSPSSRARSIRGAEGSGRRRSV
jgi:hypothetical protein